MGKSKDKTTFGQRAFQARLRLAADLGRAVSQGDVGEMVGVTGATVSRWEADKKEPDLDTLRRLATALRVSVAWLAFGDEEDGKDGGHREPDQLPAMLPAPTRRAAPALKKVQGARRRA